MTPRMGAFVVVATVGAGIFTPVSQMAQTPQATFRAHTDVVRVDVSARRGKAPVTGLTAADFEVRDSGVPQHVADVSYEKLPIDVTIALDISDSVTGQVLDQLRKSVQQLKIDLAPQDRIKLLTFNMRVKRLLDFTGPAGVPAEAIGQIAGFGSSAVFDAVAVALASATPPARRHLVVLFSDGEDTSSITSKNTLIEVARHTTPTLDFVMASSYSALVSQRSAGVEIANRNLYDQLALETGGVVVTVLFGDNITTTFHRVLDEFRASYVLHFSPQGVDRAGYHALDVRVKRTGIDVRARKGYSAQ